MRFSVTVVDGRTERAQDVLLDVDPSQSVADLFAVVSGGVHPSFVRGIAAWVDGHEVKGEQSLREAGVMPGSVVSFHEPAGEQIRDLPGGVAEVRVVGGPGAGRVHRMVLGETLVGCGAPGLSLPDLRLPADALRLETAIDGSVTVRAAAGLEATIGDTPVDGSTPWPLGSYLVAGDTVLQLRTPVDQYAQVEPAEDHAGLDLNRPPRLLPPARERSFSLPRMPKERTKRAIPWVMVFAPMLMAIPMALIFSPRYLMFGLMSPVLAIANVVNDRKTGRKDHVRAMKEYEEDLARTNQRIEDALLQEQDERREAFPDPAEVLLTAVGPGYRLWQRRTDDPDWLQLRLGLADQVAETEVTQEKQDQREDAPPPRVLADVPATFKLSDQGVVGVAGPPEARDPLAGWLLAQVGTLHSPRDVRVLLFTDEQREDQWSWVRWLPHARLPEEVIPALVGTQQESVSRRLAELSAVIGERRSSENRNAPHHPAYVVVLDGARRLRSLPGVVSLLRDGPTYGVYVICLDDEVRQLPAECSAIVVCAHDRISLRQTLADNVDRIRPDLVEPGWFVRVARGLAPIRDVSPSEESAALPDSARLLELVELDPPTPTGVLQRWRHGRTTEVVLGAGYDGAFRLDLRKDGPHALVAGTTGSGKSELLQTLVAALALANRPDELTFCLVDYKGGSAFKDCARLPHTVGMVTDLDNHLVSRALTSLGAELRRREHLLTVPGAKDLEDYWALQNSQPELPAIPRLVIVIDEFASLVAELPDFVKGLVSIAQRGRSLGIHLVLATQRPSGVVSPEIRANTNLRISLRVTDDSESKDVIDAPDAARIGKNHPGRGYARTGASSLLPFQAGRVGGAAPGAKQTDVELPPPLAWPIPWANLGLPAPARPTPKGEQTDEGDTDLSNLVQAVRAANEQAAVPAQPSPWLEPLPDLVTLDRLEQLLESEDEEAPELSAPWAMADLPAEQRQVAESFTLGRDGHLYIVGGPRTGRSTALRTIAGSLAKRVPARDLHIYGLDCGNGSLLPLSVLPHTGVVATRTQAERADRLLSRLVQLVEDRQALLGSKGYADLAEQRAAAEPDERLPYVLLLLDRWDGFMSGLGEIDGGRLTEQVYGLLRDGGSVGVHVIVTGDRTLVSGRTGSLVERKFALRQPDRQDFSVYGIPPREVPEVLVDGRGLWSESVMEAQVAVLAEDVSGTGQSEALKRIAEQVAERDRVLPPAQRPFRLEVMPTSVAYDDVVAQLDELDQPASWVPFGIGGDELDVLGLDMSGTANAMVAGPPQSGRTTALRFAVRAMQRRGAEVLGLFPNANTLSEELGENALLTEDLEIDDLVARLRGLTPGTLVVIDDAETLKESGLAPALTSLMQQGRSKGLYTLVGGSTTDLSSGYSGWLFEARKCRQGLLLSPQQPGDADVVNLRLPRSAVSGKVIPGRGLLVVPTGSYTAVQVPH